MMDGHAPVYQRRPLQAPVINRQMRVLKLAGTHYEMGRQHGYQVRNLRPAILQTMEQRLARLPQSEAETQQLILELLSVWEALGRSTLEMLRGMAEALELEWEPFLRYTIASYLEDRALRTTHHQGCTVWAAAAPITASGAPLLAKNRDYRPNHQRLQCLAYAHPEKGYRYVYLTSAGSPGVFSSGMNEAGLAVADTHVTSVDMGPGLPRYSVEMELLEHHTSVNAALEYLSSIPHIGDGTLVLIDAEGDMAVFEAGHTWQGVVCAEAGFVVSTNHFVTTPLSDQWRDCNPPALRGNSQRRYEKVKAALQTNCGQVTVGWAQQFMTSHGEPHDAICRHAELDSDSATISTVLYLPKAGQLVLAHGQPCQVAFQTWPAAFDLVFSS